MASLRSSDAQSREWLVEQCGWWRDVLDLDGWRIKVDWARPWGMQSQVSNQGECAYRYVTKDATIRILHDVDRVGNPYVSDDAEVDLVHELLHLHFSGFFCLDDSNPLNAMQEQVITVLARSLVTLKRAICGQCEHSKARDVTGCDTANDDGSCPLVQTAILQATSAVVSECAEEIEFECDGGIDCEEADADEGE